MVNNQPMLNAINEYLIDAKVTHGEDSSADRIIFHRRKTRNARVSVTVGSVTRTWWLTTETDGE